MMKQLNDWGFSREGWLKGEKGEYWVLAQGILSFAFVILPVYRPLALPPQPYQWGLWGGAIALGLGAIALAIRGVLDLGQSLTPLPHPKDDGQLVQSGAYGIVRHPLYSSLIFLALAWTLFTLSLSHLLATGVLLLFFDAKARREEVWLADKYADYASYQHRVKKLIPWLY